MFKEPNEVERAERHQETDSAPINAAVEAAEKGITTLATRQLDPNEMRSECSATRDRTILAVRDERHNIIKRANAGKETERWMVENWLREATDARILHEFTADLKKVPTRDLVDSVRYLIQVGDLARIQSVNAVFANRADNRPYKASFHNMLGRLHLFSAHYMSKQSCPPVSQPLLRVEGPSIAAPQNELICRATPWDAV